MIEGDPDLKYLREITERYGAKEFLVLTYTPTEPMTSEISMNNLLSLKYKIQSLNWVHSVITLLDIPLLNSTDETLSEKLIPVLVNTHHHEIHEIKDKFGIKRPIRLEHIVCF